MFPGEKAHFTRGTVTNFVFRILTRFCPIITIVHSLRYRRADSHADGCGHCGHCQRVGQFTRFPINLKDRNVVAVPASGQQPPPGGIHVEVPRPTAAHRLALNQRHAATLLIDCKGSDRVMSAIRSVNEFSRRMDADLRCTDELLFHFRRFADRGDRLQRNHASRPSVVGEDGDAQCQLVQYVR